MRAINRGLTICCALSLFTIPTLVGCGASDTGKWEPTNPSPNGTIISVGEEKSLGFVSTKHTPEVTPSGGPGVDVICRIPEALGQPPLFAASTTVDVNPLTSTATKVCFGRTNELGLAHCRTVNAHEARYRAIAECHKAALEQLQTLAVEAMGNDRERWLDKKVELVPAAWAIKPADATKDVGHMAGWISMLMDSERRAVPASPFCFQKERNVSVRTARDSTLFAMWWLYQSREAKANWVLSALKRGVNFIINPKASPVQVNVKFITIPSQRVNETCTFGMPTK